MRTLIIIDVQNDFIPGGALPVEEGYAIIPVINRIQHKFDLVIATQDWHPKNHKSFASNHSGKKPYDVIKLHGLDQTLWPDHCVQGSPGAELHPLLNTNRIEAVFRAGMDPEIDSYSGFYDNAHRKSTGLAGYLRENKADKLYFVGLAGDICVNYSARDALMEGFDTTIIEDATRALDVNMFTEIKSDLMKKGAHFITSGEL